jgi:hypothetical protein
MAETTAETAVRDYLTFLSDPDSLVDNIEVTRLQEEVAELVDPIQRLMAMAALTRAQSTDPHAYEKAFIEHAKAWAKDQDVPPTAFQQMGVPRHVLEAAGIMPRTGRGRGRAKAAPTKQAVTRRAAAKADELEAGILALAEPFSIKDVTEKVGGSTITVTKAVKQLEAAGKVNGAGQRANERGRASRVWTVAVEPL